MRRRLLVAAFLGTTFLTPSPAQADPVIAFVGGIVNAVSGLAGGVLAATGAVGAWSAGFSVGSFLTTTFVGRALLSFGLSAVAQSLQSSPSPSERMVNFAQEVAYAETVYGRTRKGGPFALSEAASGSDVVTGTGGDKRHYAIILASHPCEGVVQHYLDERVAEVDADGLITTEPMDGRGRIRFYDGSAGQAADAELVDKITGWTSDHDFAGLCVGILWAKKVGKSFSDVYPRGREWDYSPVIDGKNDIYDPRDEANKFTSNAALVAADWIVGKMGRTVDWDQIAAEADVADQVVTNAEDLTQARWSIDGTLSDDMSIQQQLDQIVAACDGFVYERTDGSVGFKVGRYEEPSVTLDWNDFLSMELSKGSAELNTPTEVVPKYIEPLNAWRGTPAGAFVIEEAVPPRRNEPQLNLINSHNQASRIAKRLARQSRARYNLRGTLRVKGYELIGERFVRIQHEELGLDEVFEVSKLRRTGAATFEIEALSTKEDDWDFDASTEEPERPSYNDSNTELGEIPVPTGFVSSVPFSGAIEWNWDAQPDDIAQQIRVRPSGLFFITHDVPEGNTVFQLTGLVDGLTYEAELRNVQVSQISSRASDWSATLSQTVVSDPDAPDAHQAFTASASGSDVDLAWTTPNSANYDRTRIYRALSSTDFADATLLTTQYGAPNTSYSHTDAAPGSGTWSYWAEPVNASGVAGAESGPETETI